MTIPTTDTGTVTRDREEFATSLLQKLGYPITDSNVNFLVAWMAREGTAAAFNPLATTQKSSGSYDLPGNSAHVQQYSSLQDGVTATVQTLLNGHYADILAALKAGNASASASGGMGKGLSTWSGGSYSGLDTTNVDGSSAISTTGGTSGNLSGLALQQYAEQNFPEFAYLLNDPEVGPILVKAAQEGVTDQNILQGMLSGTKWWQTTSDTVRNFNYDMATDPATQNQAIAREQQAIDQQAAQMGVQLAPQDAESLAVNYLKLGWSPQTLTQSLASYAKYQGDITYKGEAATDVNTLRGIYADYAVPVTDSTLNSQLQNVLAGKLTTQAIQDQVADQAATLYASNPQLASFLTSGKGSTAQWAAPYIAQAANLLGESENNINLTDPRYASILQPWTNPTTGQSTGQAMSLDQWTQQLKTNPTYGYSKTANGVKDYQSLADGIVNAFGGGLVSQQ